LDGSAWALKWAFEHAGPDAVNGFGGTGGGFVVPGTSFSVTLSAATPPGTYQVRVIGLSPTGQPVGTFSDAVPAAIE
jgi:hypothetical protein